MASYIELVPVSCQGGSLSSGLILWSRAQTQVQIYQSGCHLGVFSLTVLPIHYNLPNQLQIFAPISPPIKWRNMGHVTRQREPLTPGLFLISLFLSHMVMSPLKLWTMHYAALCSKYLKIMMGKCMWNNDRMNFKVSGFIKYSL